MKLGKNTLLAGGIVAVAALSSCGKLDIENPNGGKAPSFSTAKEAAAYTYTGELGRISAMLTQQLQGNDIHYEPIYSQYILSDSKLKSPYNTAYRHGISLGIDDGSEEGKLIAGLIYSVVMEFYSNAEKYEKRGEQGPQLTYQDIHTLLSEIGGDYAHVAAMVNARVYLNEGNYAEALAALPTNLKATDGYYVSHAGSSTNMNEWARFVTSRGGYLTADANIYNLKLKIAGAKFVGGDDYLQYPLPATANVIFGADTVQVSTAQMDTFEHAGLMANDPRVPVYYGDGTTFGFPVSKNEKSYLIDYAEAKFIEAEARLNLNGVSDAQDAYKAAVQASFDLSGVDGSTYIPTIETLPTDVEQAKEQIMIQKYLHMFGHPMAFADYKRTTYPKLNLKGVTFPTKWKYFYQ